MILVEKGLIKLDDNVSKYLPEFSQMYCKGGQENTYVINL